jgi:deoxycytidylate deaminase
MSITASVMKFHEPSQRETRELLNGLASNELIFAVVGPVGSGTTFVAKALEQLAASALNTKHVKLIKASLVIGDKLPSSSSGETRLTHAQYLQDAGDALRKQDPSAVGNLLVGRIKAEREVFEKGGASSSATPIRPLDAPDKTARIFIVDSLKNPAEVELLRSVYREAFCLIGVVCESDARLRRLQNEKLKESSATQIKEFMKRDENASENWGQKVVDTFHLADFFVDNTPDRFTEDKTENKDWVVNDKLGRLLDILTGKKIVRPFPSETGMFHAAGAQLRSACLSRQVGAALTDKAGNLIATGTNEVPKAGGGVYGDGFEVERSEIFQDHRCLMTNKFCSNTKIQDEIMTEVIEAIPELKVAADRTKIKTALKATALGRLLEFSRAVHAEMDALLTAARIGAPTIGAKLFVTTFPCHYCARHVVSAGVDEVQYIEPYPKSRAFDLHSDAIEQIFTKWVTVPPAKPTKVLFRPFTGVAPRLYRRAFMKDRKLKDEAGNLDIGKPKWATGLLVESYLQIETTLEEKGKNETS